MKKKCPHTICINIRIWSLLTSGAIRMEDGEKEQARVRRGRRVAGKRRGGEEEGQEKERYINNPP